MRPRHAAVISLLLALSVAMGAYAAQRTMATTSHAAAKGAQLSPRWLAGLAPSTAWRPRFGAPSDSDLRRSPACRTTSRCTRSRLPPAATPLAATVARAPAAAPRTIFVRPPAHIVTVHRHGGEGDDGEGDGGGGAHRFAATGKPGHGGYQSGGGDD